MTADATRAAAVTAPTTVRAAVLIDILREIARGGLAGLLAGVIVGGLGGRLAMRAATLLLPEAVGRITENGNRIGDVTFDGTVALVIFGGLLAGVLAASTWVVIQPWLPPARA